VDLAGSDYDLKKKYDFRQVEILREYAFDVPPVLCEAGKIQQVLLNLLRNGAEAMQEMAGKGDGYQPRFILRLGHEKEAGKVRIELEDNGPGMDAAVCKRVFEPFFTTKPTGKGTGLGLSVSYFIVAENHGGEMSVVSAPGKGTTFIVELPVGKK
jgi:signal transduction histidine kinase